MAKTAEHAPGLLMVSRHVPTRIDGPPDGMLAPNAVAVACGAGELGEANAAHLAACWNACAGINPEAVPKLLEVARDVIAYGEGIGQLTHIVAKAVAALAEETE